LISLGIKAMFSLKIILALEKLLEGFLVVDGEN
jgi:hypothetical protein